MDPIGKYAASKKAIVYETIAFLGIIGFIWLDEYLDLPAKIFGAEPTPTNWQEALSESLFVLVVGIVIVDYTRRLFRRMKYLEGILPVCAGCKKIRDEQGDWQPIETYIHDRSEAKCSHGLCPECIERLYPEIAAELRAKKEKRG